MEISKQTLRLQLNDPGLSALHRAGLAGLWMTLDALSEEKELAENQWLDWQLDARGVEITWEGTPRTLLEWLLPKAFGIDERQMIDFIALRAANSNPAAKATLHNGILGTFLQHGKTRGVLKGQYTHPIQIDESTIILNYAGLGWYNHQKVIDVLCDDKNWVDAVALAGWFAPGSVVRHTAFASDTALEEPPPRALLLLFAPVGCFYFNLRSALHAQKARFALVIPQIDNLEAYAKTRRLYCAANLLELTASGTGDAALRVALFIAKDETRDELRRLKASCRQCQVITLGTVPWSTQQKTRTATLVVSLPPDQKIRLYREIKNALNTRIARGRSTKKGEPPPTFVATSVALEHFTENIAHGRNWYEGFAGLMSNSETYNVVKFESEGLNKVIQNLVQIGELDKPREILVKACHEALKNRYGQVKDSAKKERADVETRLQREYDKLRVGLARCKNASTFRQELTDFWSRAGHLKTLQDDWSEVMPMLKDENWAEARDLALLALASYKRPEKPSGNQDAGVLER
jgi:CRISPR-associated protein Cas8a1/Csx13